MLPDARPGLALIACLMGVALASHAQVAGGAPDKRAAAPEVGAAELTGVRPVGGIDPGSVRLGSDKDARCLQVVVVVDPIRACQVQQCVKAFPSRRSLALKQNQRALLAGKCGADSAKVKPSLLWGSASVLVLQGERKGAGLWTPVRIGRAHAVRLETEGSYGALTWSAAGFVWKETPD
jgi:hypothetical protein